MNQDTNRCPQCKKPWHERPGWGCRLIAHQAATHNPRLPEETLEAPAIGWGVLTPDAVLKPETIALIEALAALPVGQRDALLTRAVPRYLTITSDSELPEDHQPDGTEMAFASGDLCQLWQDVLGTP